MPPALARRVLEVMGAAAVVVDQADEVVLANPAARRMGVGPRRPGGGGRAAPAGPAGPPRRRAAAGEVDTPRGRLGREPVAVSVQVGAAGRVRLRGAAAGGRHRGAPAGGCAATSWPTCQPRAEDADRRAAAARRGGWPRTAADDPEAAIRRFAERIQHEGTRLGRLVNELLELSRLQGAEPLPAPEPVSVDCGRRRGGGPHPAPRPPPRASTVRGRRPAPADRLRQRAASSPPRWPTWSRTRSPTAPEGTRWRSSARARRRPGRDPRHRPGHRHRRRRPGPDLRAVLPGRPGPVARDRRHRARAGHRQAHRHQPRRPGRRVQPAGRRLDVHPAAAGPPAGAALPLPTRWTPERSDARAPEQAPAARNRKSGGPRAGGRGRGVVLRRAVLHAAQGGLRGRRSRRPARPR